MNRAVEVVVGAVILVGFAACGPHKTSGSPTAVGTPPRPAFEQEALTAYRGMWTAFEQAAATADPDNSDLRTYASDDALRLIVASLVSDRSKGMVIKGALHLDPTMTTPSPMTTPTQVGIADCVDMRNWLIYKASGGLWDNVPGGFHYVTATVKESGQTWKVTTLVVGAIGSCGPGGVASSAA